MSMMRREESGNPLRRVFGNPRLLRAMGATARPYRPRILFLGVLITAGTLVPLAPPVLYRSIIDRLIPGAAFLDVLPMTILAALVTVLGVLFAHSYTVQAADLGRGIVADIQNLMYRRLADKPLEFFTTVKAGAVGTRLTADVYAAEPLFTKVLVGIADLPPRPPVSGF